MSIKENLQKIEQEIYNACMRANRNPEEVKIIAVTKYIDIEKTKEVLDAGIVHIGENRVEGGVEKAEALGNRGVWHFIGTLQSRKVKKMIDKFSYIHSLERESLAREIDKRAKAGTKVNCFVQVNVSGEESKSGLRSEEVIPFFRSLEQFQAIHVVGLMTMAPFYENPEKTRPFFKKLKELQLEVQALNLPYAPCQELSMGMSNDYIVAVEEGATFVRIGTALVGSH